MTTQPHRMKSLGFAITAVAALITQGCAPSAAPSVENKSDLAAALTAQGDAWDKAIIRKDRAAIEANMADDFRQIDGQGNVSVKKAFVEDLMSPDIEIDPYTVEDFDVRIYGDTALLSGTTKMTGKYKGKVFNSHYRYIDIYVRRDGVWKVVSVQTSSMPN